MGAVARFRFQAVRSLAVVVLIASCGGQSGTTQSVSLATLVESPEQWAGKRIEVRGELLHFNDPGGGRHGVVENAEQDRIGLKDIEAWQSLIGQQVVAQGTVEFDPSFGWYLNQPSLTAVLGLLGQG